MMTMITNLFEIPGMTTSRKKDSRPVTYQAVEQGEDDSIYTKDGTVDYCNNPANKLITGTWKACPYILGVFVTHFKLLQIMV